MTQQVLKSRVTLQSTVPYLDNVSLDWIWEATGSSTNIDFTVSPSPDSVIEAFFNTAAASHSPMYQYLAQEISRATNACQISYTDITNHLDGTPAGSPTRQTNFTLNSGPAGPMLPGDVAAVCSFRADYGSALEHGPETELPTPDDAQDYGAPPTHMGKTRPRARMRSRFYLGPLNSNQVLGSSGGVLAPSFVASLQDQLSYLCQVHGQGTASQFQLAIWSRRDVAVHSPAFLFISEAFGTVRRRQDVTANRVHSWTPVTRIVPD